MQLSVSQIAQKINGELHGSSTTMITGAAGLTDASPTDLSYLKDTTSNKVLEQFQHSKAGVVIVPKGFPSNGRTVIEVNNPVGGFSQILDILAGEKAIAVKGIHPTAYVSTSAKIGKDVGIGPQCVIEDGAEIDDGASLIGQVYIGPSSKVGKRTTLYPQVVLREGVSVGNDCILHSGVVIGTDGYGFYFHNGVHNKIPQIGTVIIEDHVEIGSNSCIDRATTGATIIGQGTKIDNLVQIAHNVKTGRHCLIVAQVGIAGSCQLGQYVILAGQAGVADHIHISDGAKIGGQAGVIQDVPPQVELAGMPAQPRGEFFRQQLFMRRLADLFKDVKKIKEIVLKK